MIKVNLLNSVTERQGGTMVSVDRKVSSPGTRLLLMTLAIAFLTIAVIGWDVISTHMAKTRAENEKAEQEQIARELEVVMNEQKELEAKIQHIDLRIEAIKKLRNSQAGPSAVLEAVRERIAMIPGLYLESIEQAGDMVTIRGNSPNESAVTQFGRSLEFSNGLFANLNIETQLQELTNQAVTVSEGRDAPKVNVVNFKIDTKYQPEKAAVQGDAESTTASTTASPAAAGAPVQTANN